MTTRHRSRLTNRQTTRWGADPYTDVRACPGRGQVVCCLCPTDGRRGT